MTYTISKEVDLSNFIVDFNINQYINGLKDTIITNDTITHYIITKEIKVSSLIKQVKRWHHNQRKKTKDIWYMNNACIYYLPNQDYEQCKAMIERQLNAII